MIPNLWAILGVMVFYVVIWDGIGNHDFPSICVCFSRGFMIPNIGAIFGIMISQACVSVVTRNS